MINNWRLRSGEVVVDRKNSHLQKEVEACLVEALAKIDSFGREFLEEEIKLGRIVGKTICVATTPSDEIIFAQRSKRQGLTRFVKNRQPEDCSSVVVILKKAVECNTYLLVTAFIGKISEPEPRDKKYFSQQKDFQKAEERSSQFWSSHALIWNSNEIISGTETKVCPW